MSSGASKRMEQRTIAMAPPGVIAPESSLHAARTAAVVTAPNEKIPSVTKRTS